MPGTMVVFVGFMLAWFAVVGAAVGSFLNVVAYRTPRGLSLVRPGSFCPRCRRPIRWRDNVPVLGWLWLRGKCRDCGGAISGRYPLVEALTGLTFALLAAAEAWAVGDRWGVVELDGARVIAVSLDTLWLAAARFGMHAAWLATTIAAALIVFDRQAPPWRLFAPALLVGLAAPWLWAPLTPGTIFDTATWRDVPPIVWGASGLAWVGLSLIAGSIGAARRRGAQLRSLLLVGAAGAVVLGAPAALIVLAAAAVIDVAQLVAVGGANRFAAWPTVAFVPPAALAWIAWRPLWEQLLAMRPL